MSSNKFEPQFGEDVLDVDLPELDERVAAGPVADYLQVFGLARDPFEDRPDETEFFPSSTHQHVSQQLQHLLHYGSGVLLLSGEEGSGRSLLTRAVLSKLDADTVACALELPAAATAEQVLAEVAHGLAFGGEPDYKRRDWVDAISDVCDEMADEGQSLLMVVDDADRQSDDAIGAVLDVISRQPARARALLVVRGQALERFKRMLAQRDVPAQALTLSGLTSDEVYDYLRFRFQRAGNEGFPFSSSQVEEIIEASGGLPSAVNIQARRLLAASGGGESGLSRLSLPFGLNQYHLGGIVAALALLMLAVLYAPKSGRDDASSAVEPVASPEVAREAPAPAKPEPMKSIALPSPVQPEQAAPAPSASIGGVNEHLEPATAAAPAPAAMSGAIQRAAPQVTNAAGQAAASTANAVAPVTTKDAAAVATPGVAGVAAPVAAQPAEMKPAEAKPAVAAAAPKAELASAAAKAPAAKPEAVEQRKSAEPKKVVEKAKPVAQKPAKVSAESSAPAGAVGRGYTIQLAGASSEASLRRAIAAKAPGLQVRYLRSTLNGKPFFIAVSGDYKTAAAAKVGLAALPAALRAEHPWVVSSAALQAKIRQGQ